MTAVEWLIEQMQNGNFNSTHTKERWSITYPADMGSPLEIAKQMEKEQIMNAFDSGLEYDYDESETYYNETYKK
jgi:hypothetical protein